MEKHHAEKNCGNLVVDFWVNLRDIVRMMTFQTQRATSAPKRKERAASVGREEAFVLPMAAFVPAEERGMMGGVDNR